MYQLANLPPELLIKVFSNLFFRDILHCQACCQQFRTLVEQSGQLQYIIQADTSGVDEGSLSGSSFGDRLRVLQRREQGWHDFKYRATVSVPVNFFSSGIYDLTGGAFLLGTRPSFGSPRTTSGFSYLPLPSLDADGRCPGPEAINWKHVDLGEQIIDVGLAVREHDLIAVLTSRLDTDGEVPNLVLELRLLSFSTGKPHPQAENHTLFVDNRTPHFGRSSILIEIVGDYLALLLTFPWVRMGEGDAFYLVNWKKGILNRVAMPQDPPASFTFLTPDILVFSQPETCTLEITKIIAPSPEALPTLTSLVILKLPPLTNHASIVHLVCRSEPNPTAASVSNPTDAIILFNMLVQDVGPVHVGHMHMFSFITHRSTLLSHVPLSERSTPFVSSSPPLSVPGGDAIDENEPVLSVFNWADWGPRATRWFDCDRISTRWITTTAGQRYVCAADPDQGEAPIVLRDFNPYNVWRQRQREERGEDTGRMRIVESSSVITSSGLFKRDLESALPYTEVESERPYMYDGVLIDEERMLGLRIQPDGIGVGQFDVLIFG
ncbi:hypothetical protein DENSPDRAFT_313633 [Dentipellis sp. KUC8613]|nr:hypothetical protein DENSPDRAFT_313633 [Dentipellis sp. KUC8613]